MGAAFADGLGQGILGMAEFVHQALQADGLFQGRQVLALKVFDQGNLKGFLVRQHFDQDRHLVELRQLRGPQTPFAGNDLVIARAVGMFAHQDRLQYAKLADRLSKVLQFFLVHGAPRLVAPGMKFFDGDLLRPGGWRRRLVLTQKGRQAAA